MAASQSVGDKNKETLLNSLKGNVIWTENITDAGNNQFSLNPNGFLNTSKLQLSAANDKLNALINEETGKLDLLTKGTKTPISTKTAFGNLSKLAKKMPQIKNLGSNDIGDLTDIVEDVVVTDTKIKTRVDDCHNLERAYLKKHIELYFISRNSRDLYDGIYRMTEFYRMLREITCIPKSQGGGGVKMPPKLDILKSITDTFSLDDNAKKTVKDKAKATIATKNTIVGGGLIKDFKLLKDFRATFDGYDKFMGIMVTIDGNGTKTAERNPGHNDLETHNTEIADWTTMLNNYAQTADVQGLIVNEDGYENAIDAIKSSEVHGRISNDDGTIQKYTKFFAGCHLYEYLYLRKHIEFLNLFKFMAYLLIYYTYTYIVVTIYITFLVDCAKKEPDEDVRPGPPGVLPRRVRPGPVRPGPDDAKDLWYIIEKMNELVSQQQKMYNHTIGRYKTFMKQFNVSQLGGASQVDASVMKLVESLLGVLESLNGNAAAQSNTGAEVGSTPIADDLFPFQPNMENKTIEYHAEGGGGMVESVKALYNSLSQTISVVPATATAATAATALSASRPSSMPNLINSLLGVLQNIKNVAPAAVAPTSDIKSLKNILQSEYSDYYKMVKAVNKYKLLPVEEQSTKLDSFITDNNKENGFFKTNPKFTSDTFEDMITKYSTDIGAIMNEINNNIDNDKAYDGSLLNDNTVYGMKKFNTENNENKSLIGEIFLKFLLDLNGLAGAFVKIWDAENMTGGDSIMRVDNDKIIFGGNDEVYKSKCCVGGCNAQDPPLPLKYGPFKGVFDSKTNTNVYDFITGNYRIFEHIGFKQEDQKCKEESQAGGQAGGQVDTEFPSPKNFRLFAFGYSGSGKTYTMIKGSKEDPSIMTNTIEYLITQSRTDCHNTDSGFKDLTIELYYPLEDINKYTPKNISNVPNISSIIKTLKEATKDTSDLSAQVQNLVDAVEKYMINNLYIVPTTNNPNSSRAFAIYTIKTRNDNQGNIVFTDMPGNEKTSLIKTDFLFDKDFLIFLGGQKDPKIVNPITVPQYKGPPVLITANNNEFPKMSVIQYFSEMNNSEVLNDLAKRQFIEWRHLVNIKVINTQIKEYMNSALKNPLVINNDQYLGIISVTWKSIVNLLNRLPKEEKFKEDGGAMNKKFYFILSDEMAEKFNNTFETKLQSIIAGNHGNKTPNYDTSTNVLKKVWNVVFNPIYDVDAGNYSINYTKSEKSIEANNNKRWWSDKIFDECIKNQNKNMKTILADIGGIYNNVLSPIIYVYYCIIKNFVDKITNTNTKSNYVQIQKTKLKMYFSYRIIDFITSQGDAINTALENHRFVFLNKSDYFKENYEVGTYKTINLDVSTPSNFPSDYFTLNDEGLITDNKNKISGLKDNDIINSITLSNSTRFASKPQPQVKTTINRSDGHFLEKITEGLQKYTSGVIVKITLERKDMPAVVNNVKDRKYILDKDSFGKIIGFKKDDPFKLKVNINDVEYTENINRKPLPKMINLLYGIDTSGEDILPNEKFVTLIAIKRLAEVGGDLQRARCAFAQESLEFANQISGNSDAETVTTLN
jgi:hypothetical protein